MPPNFFKPVPISPKPPSFFKHVANPPSQTTLPTFNTLGNRPIESGITVAHYEFYTTITFSSLHPSQEVLQKRGSQNETIKLIILYTSPGGSGYKGIYDTVKRVSTVNIAQGITKEAHKGFVAWVFDNDGPDGMNAFLINHEFTSFTTTINLGLSFTTPLARQISAKIPSGGFCPVQPLKTMPQKVRRLYQACQSQRDGVVQAKMCSVCRERSGRECRKVRGRGNCTWCGYFGRRCWIGEEGNVRTGTESIDGSEMDAEEEDGRAKMQRRVRRKPSRQTLAERKPLKVAGSRTLGGRVEKKPSSSSLRQGGAGFDIRDFQYPRDEEDDCAVQSDDSALVHNTTPQKSSSKAQSFEMDD